MVDNMDNNMTTRRRSKSIQRQEKNKPVSVSHKTANQKDYIHKIVKNDIVICTGPSGCGKTYIAAGMAAQKLYNEEIDQIVITRPLVCAGEDIGAFPGDVDGKIMPHYRPIEAKLQFFLKNHYRLFVNDKRILYLPLELMRGETFDNAYMILDEAQNCTEAQIKMFMTRIGQDSKVLINGDINQTDLRGFSGLASCVNKLMGVEDIGIARLTIHDIQRHGIIGRVLNALEGVSTDIKDDEDYDDYYVEEDW